MKMKKLFNIMLLFVLCLSLAACGGAPAAPSAAPAAPAAPAASSADPAADPGAEPITFKLGVIAPFSGANAVRGTYIDQGIAYAVEELKSMPGYEHITFEILKEDTESDASIAVTAAEKLIQRDNVHGLIVSDSGPSLAVLPIATGAEIPMFVTAFSPALTEQGSGYIFRSTISDSASAQGVAQYLVNEGYTKIAVAGSNSEFGQGGVVPFIEKVKELGLEVVAHETYAENDVDFSSQLMKIREAAPEVLFLHSNEAAASAITKQIREMGMTFDITGLSPMATMQVRDIVGDEFMEGTRASVAFLNSDDRKMVQDFVAGFTAKFGEAPDHNVARAHAAAMVYAEAIKICASTDGPTLAQTIHGIKDLELPGGIYSFDAKGEGLTGAANVIGRWESGKFSFLIRMGDLIS